MHNEWVRSNVALFWSTPDYSGCISFSWLSCHRRSLLFFWWCTIFLFLFSQNSSGVFLYVLYSFWHSLKSYLAPGNRHSTRLITTTVFFSCSAAQLDFVCCSLHFRHVFRIRYQWCNNAGWTCLRNFWWRKTSMRRAWRAYTGDVESCYCTGPRPVRNIGSWFSYQHG